MQALLIGAKRQPEPLGIALRGLFALEDEREPGIQSPHRVGVAQGGQLSLGLGDAGAVVQAPARIGQFGSVVRHELLELRIVWRRGQGLALLDDRLAQFVTGICKTLRFQVECSHVLQCRAQVTIVDWRFGIPVG